MLQHCEVDPTCRRRGVASLLTRARLMAAVEAGAYHAVLSPSPDGALLHATLGFTVVPAAANR